MAPTPRIPTIDLAPWLRGDPEARALVAAQVDEALSRAGFLLVTGHGVSRELRDGVRAAARTFFALPPEVKQRYVVQVGWRGWLGQGAEANGYAEGTATPPDLKESWTCGADQPTGDREIDTFWFQPNRWPQAQAPLLQGAVEEYLARMRTVADELLRLLAAALTVNIGDLMARWTGDRWRSGRHRVLPPSPEAPQEDLMSLVYFYECDPHTTVTPLPAPVGRVAYDPVDSSAYLRGKLDAITVA